jgi:hypothetical protein
MSIIQVVMRAADVRVKRDVRRWTCLRSTLSVFEWQQFQSECLQCILDRDVTIDSIGSNIRYLLFHDLVQIFTCTAKQLEGVRSVLCFAINSLQMFCKHQLARVS